MFDVIITIAELVPFLFALWYLVHVALAIYELAFKRTVSVPRGLSVVLRKGETMANVLTYRVSVNAPVDGDVVSRELTVTVNGVESTVVTAAGNATDLGSVDVPQDALVVLSLVDVDDAGNKSEPATVEFTALDTLAPAQPGGFNVTLVSEKVVEESTPETDTTNG